MTEETHLPEGWGIDCPHGKRIVVRDEESDGIWPCGKIVEPWPCNLCTREQFEAQQAEETAEFDRQAPTWEEMYGL